METKIANSILATRAGLKRHGKSCFDYVIPKEVAVKIGSSAAYGSKRRLSVPSSSKSGHPVPNTSQESSVHVDNSRPTASKDNLTNENLSDEENEDDLSLFLLIWIQ